jgi:hypothetical protein
MNNRKSISTTKAHDILTSPEKQSTTKNVMMDGQTVPTQTELTTTAKKRAGASHSKGLSAIRPVPRRGLSRLEAAMYIGVSAGKFDELVRNGRMPGPRRIDNRKVWDLHELDNAFEDLPLDDEARDRSWDGV